MLTVFVPLFASAMPEYALREHKQCVYCHFDPRGGGPVNAAGRYFAQHLSLEGYIDKKLRKQKRVKKTAPNAESGVANSGAPTSSDNSFVPKGAPGSSTNIPATDNPGAGQ